MVHRFRSIVDEIRKFRRFPLESRAFATGQQEVEMRWIVQMVMTAAFTAPVSAQAANWWWIAGKPEDAAIFFADAETMVRRNGDVILHVQRVEKSGKVIETVAHVQCSAPQTAQEENPLSLFACSTEDERMHLGIMLGDRTPSQTTRVTSR